MKNTFQAVLLFVLPFSPLLPAQTIDFETVPGVVAPIDGMAISNQFQSAFGFGFRLEDGSLPVLAKVGAPLTAFSGPTGDDGPALNQNVGSFFLTDDGQTGLAPPALIISYEVPVAAASGAILDIDSNPVLGGAERWRVEARGSGNVVLASILLAPGSFNGGDGRATPWNFSCPTNDIHLVRVIYAGTKPTVSGWPLTTSLPRGPSKRPGCA